jgi:hypothetical protein
VLPMSVRGRNGCDSMDKNYFHEYFAMGFILHGKVIHLEEIKTHIISEYVEKKVLAMLKPTYSQKPLSVVCESVHTNILKGEIPGEFYLAFILWGEPQYTEEVKKFIDSYVEKGFIDVMRTCYTKGKQFIKDTENCGQEGEVYT